MLWVRAFVSFPNERVRASWKRGRLTWAGSDVGKFLLDVRIGEQCAENDESRTVRIDGLTRPCLDLVLSTETTQACVVDGPLAGHGAEGCDVCFQVIHARVGWVGGAIVGGWLGVFGLGATVTAFLELGSCD